MRRQRTIVDRVLRRRPTRAQLEAEIAALEARITDLESRQDSACPEQLALCRTALTDCYWRNDQLATKVSDMESQLDEQKAIVKRLQGFLDICESALIKCGDELAECEAGNPPPIDPPPIDPPPIDPPPVITQVGWARETKGGAGGDIHIVTTVNPYGPGSIGKALAAVGPTIIIPATGLEDEGPIFTNEPIIAGTEWTTLRGFINPIRNGGALQAGALLIRAPEVIIEDMRIRPGASAMETDELSCIGIGGQATHHVYLKSVSCAFAVDVAINVFASIVTAYRCIFAWTLHNSNHVKGPHGFAATISSGPDRDPNEQISFIECIFAGFKKRPNVTNASAEFLNCLFATDDLMDMAMSIGDKWASQGGQSPAKVDVRGNWINQNLPERRGFIGASPGQTTETAMSHLSGNISNVPLWSDPFPGLVSSVPLQSSEYGPMGEDAVYEHVLAVAGARPDGKLDAIDMELVRRIRERTVGIIDSEADLGL